MILALVIGALASSACGPATTQRGQVTSATVEAIVDGDTIDVHIDGRPERVRLLGIDTPESVSRHVPQQCFGAEATQALSELLPVGSQVDVLRDTDARDRYGRLLLYLYRPEDGLFINLWLVESGFAEAVSYEPNVAHQLDFIAAQQRAEADRNGLWSSCDGPDQPLD